LVRGLAGASFVDTGELGANRVRVRAAEVLEDGEGLLPGLLGLPQLASGLAGVAKAVLPTLISIAVAGKPDPVTAAIIRHLDESGSVYLELPNGRLALILDLSGATWLTRRDAQYLRD
jgi:hypothetical protein